MTPEQRAQVEAKIAQLRTTPDPFGQNGRLIAQLEAQLRAGAATDQVDKQAGAAASFADQGQKNFGALRAESAALRDQLRGYASGQSSLSAEQLRQGLQRNIAGQQAMAASARPANAPMAALSAMQNAGAAASGLAGQQAMAGIAERQAATQSLGNMIGQERGLELNATLGSRGQATGAYTDIASGFRQDQAASDAKSEANKQRLMTAAAMAAMAFSDERLKTGIRDGRKDADDFVKGLKAYRYKYKGNGDYGPEGEHLGIMAQDLERTKLGRQAVVDTPRGKAVDGARLATQLAAVTARLGERLSKLEGKGK